ncbi:MAG: cyclic nucleotide-binding domain-containing protein [Deltaproteobacteria bacterium]|nr:cyclic nucleotide-binding domain-containing protein [Deltaproteobacteria bacterium]
MAESFATLQDLVKGDKGAEARVRLLTLARQIKECGAKAIPDERLAYLKRGGVLVRLKSGNIQFGSPPETVKDSLPLGGAKLVVIDGPTIMDWYGVRNQGEPEFPMYSGFFIVSKLKSATQFLTTNDVASHLDTILKTSYMGPQWDFENDDLAPEYPQGKATPGFPNMRGELRHFSSFDIDRMRQINTFGETGVFVAGEARIVHLGESVYRVFEGDEYVGDLDMKTLPKPERVLPDLEKLYDAQFQAVRYRALFLGEPMAIPVSSSHGFDGVEGTSGHMIWNRGKVVLVDPPSNILDFFAANHVPLNAIDGVIITHVHADHDQGALQVLMASSSANLYTTASIERAYVDKLHALSLGKFPKERIRELWQSKNLRMLEPVELNGLTMYFYHGFHANIAIGYNILGENGKVVFGYSGDTMNDPAVVYSLLKPKMDAEGKVIAEPVIASPERAAIITELPLAALWAGGFAVHEQGVAPIHTPGSRLKSVKNVAETMNAGGEIYAYHVTQKDAEATGLKKWGAGFAHAIAFARHLSWREQNPEQNTVRAMESLPIFEGVSKKDLEALANAGEMQLFKPESSIIQEGLEDNKVYLILDGAVDICRGDGKVIAKKEAGLLGEGALLGEGRNATVVATKPTRVLVWDAAKQKAGFEKIGLVERLQHLRNMRQIAYGALSASSIMDGANPEVVDALLGIGERIDAVPGSIFIRRGESDRVVYFVVDGIVDVVTAARREALNVGRGDFVGEMALVNDAPRTATVMTESQATLIKFPAARLHTLMAQWPTVKLRLMALAMQRGQTIAGPH